LLISPEIDNRRKVVPRVLYVINAGTRRAPQLVRKLVELDIQLTVTVGRDEKLHRAIEKAAGNRKIDIFGWTDEMPRLLCENHLLIGKAGGATVQETIAAGCPMIINHVVSGKKKVTRDSSLQQTPARSRFRTMKPSHKFSAAFASDAKQWHQWSANIGKLSARAHRSTSRIFVVALAPKNFFAGNECSEDFELPRNDTRSASPPILN